SPPLAALQIGLAHQSSNTLFVHRGAVSPDLVRHAPASIAPSMSALTLANLFEEPFVRMPASRLRTSLRGMPATTRDAQQVAHHRHAEGFFLRGDPSVLHIDSFAKYAAAFFKISFSCFNRAFSWRSRAFSACTSSSGCND